ncbi:hypothetical protein QQF64_007570 [Cirrhinus molitorella]|uniref:Ig-like domain-containing protein n=1 Tax=Cirrhinus molitorella TaxID=172907 RepID=A0ABR3MBP5_9TELE
MIVLQSSSVLSKKQVQERKNIDPPLIPATAAPKRAGGPVRPVPTGNSMVQSNDPVLSALSSIQSSLSDMNSRIQALETGLSTQVHEPRVGHGLDRFCWFGQSNPCYAALGHKLNLLMVQDTSEYDLMIHKRIYNPQDDPVCRIKNDKMRDCDLFNNRAVVTVINGTLIINRVIRADSGDYTLRLDRSDGRETSRDLQVIVEGLDRFCWFSPSDPCYAALGHKIKLPMVLDDSVYDLKLIKRIDNNRQAEPVCRVQYGKKKKSPIGPVEVSIICSSSGVMRVSCSSEGDLLLYSWTLNGDPLMDGDSSIDLDEETDGDISCSVKNHVSHTQKTIRVKPCPVCSVSVVFVLVWCFQLMVLFGLLGGFHIYMRHTSETMQWFPNSVVSTDECQSVSSVRVISDCVTEAASRSSAGTGLFWKLDFREMMLICGLMLLLQTAACLDRFCWFDQSDPCYATLGHKLNLLMVLDARKYDLKIQKINNTDNDAVCRVKYGRIRECDLYNNRPDVSIVNGMLIINHVIRADSGNYKLSLILHSQAIVTSRYLQVIVEGLDRFCWFDQSDSCYATLGHKLNLMMVRDTSEYDLKLWKKINNTQDIQVCRVKDDKILEKECDHYNNRSEVTVINGMLIINRVIREDSGNYILYFTEPWGIGELQVNVEAPIGSVEVSIICSSSGVMRASCSSEGDQLLYSWTLNGEILVQGPMVRKITTIDLNEGTEGKHQLQREEPCRYDKSPLESNPALF